ncbi:MAG: hypothetical protein OXC67_10075 [Flavobacteriaceae bacterium]|nr:hypothetical protein [Flavobacteriaceae bacterium]MCY4300074.1 hypothetical protein [Flavobacteriaceae bacterium]
MQSTELARVASDDGSVVKNQKETSRRAHHQDIKVILLKNKRDA